MLRRTFLKSLMALAATPALGANGEGEPGFKLGEKTPFSQADLLKLAEALSRETYQAAPSFPKAWSDISYEDYVSIWFDSRNALWTNEADTPLRVDAFPPGLYYDQAVDISVLENGFARKISFDLNVFDKTDKFPDLPVDETLGYSGLKLRAEIEKKNIFQEFAVFQGASYFRAIGTGDIYGLSARGLAIDTAEASGEEFPDFRAFWLEKPKAGTTTFIVHALLDSPRCTGAYRFAITPNNPLTMDVEATLFAREELSHIGLGPLTSMFQFDDTNRNRFSDFRSAVHDSDGLLIVNGAGETLWRPLANPKDLQVSAFVDDNPKGFGLMQRARKLSDFADLHAHYHRRPGVWVEPKEAWGRGAVTLVEIPTDSEIYDNIVAYWRPEKPLTPDAPLSLSYRLIWGGMSDYGQGLKIINTRMGKAFADGIIIAIDYAPDASLPDDLSTIDINIRASGGEVSKGNLFRNPETGGARLDFKFDPKGASLIEFRADLLLEGAVLGETWLYRWTAP